MTLDNGTDGQTDRQTDRQSATQYAAPPREEGRIITKSGRRTEPWGTEQGMITTADFLPAYTT